MKFFTNYSLKKHNTFGIDCKSKYYVSIENESDLRNLANSPILQNNKCFIIGSGSNLLFADDFDGLIIDVNIKGISVKSRNENSIIIESGAGEKWHSFVEYSVNNNYFGAENLALIPGKVGAAPVQNIGAYGIEQKDIFHSLTGFNLQTEEFVEFPKDKCDFGYRNSIFKNEFSINFIITSVRYELNSEPKLNLNYNDIKAFLKNARIDNPKPIDIFNAISSIRQGKLPDFEKIGNAGSFFKNPVITSVQYLNIKSNIPEISGWEQSDGSMKLSAGQLIEYCGWKGKTKGNAGVYDNHALVLVNLGNATGKEILSLADDITESVYDKFGIILEKEVLVVR